MSIQKEGKVYHLHCEGDLVRNFELALTTSHQGKV